MRAYAVFKIFRSFVGNIGTTRVCGVVQAWAGASVLPWYRAAHTKEPES